MPAHDDEASPISPASVRDVLAVIADTVAPEPSAPPRLGSVTLHPHQREGAERIRRIIEREGGALLCDAVGIGKTYVALAVASRFDSCLVVAPAVLREMWTRAIAATAVSATIVSVESLGRRRERLPSAPLVIVDEAHHLRNPGTRRYDAAARMCATACALLLTATPLHNTRRDLAALVALFAGVRAHAWTDDELASVVVRRDRGSVGSLQLPRIEHATVPTIAVDDGVLDEILALPPPVPPADGVEAASLVTNALVRQWASSGAALRGAIRRRVTRGHALLAAFADGRHPTRAELREWLCTEDTIQLAFTELVTPTVMRDPAFRVALERHVHALSTLLQRVGSAERGDENRASVVRAICARHAPGRVVAFTCYQETGEMLYRALRQRLRTALLTGRGGVVAGGSLTRAETIARFAPEAAGVRAVAEHERIDLLVTTDLLSEGVNLQDAAVVIHLDLPWTSARLAQRVGRLARVGSRHAVVTAYTLRPPPRAESMLRGAEIIQRKAALAARVLGAASESAVPATWLDVGGPHQPAQRSSVECAEAIRQRLASHARGRIAGHGRPLVARCLGTDACALVACVVDDVPRLVVVRDGRVDSSAGAVLAAVDCALASSVELECDDLRGTREVVRSVERWRRSLVAARDAGVELPEGDGRARAAMRTRRRSIARLDGAVSAAPFMARDAAAQHAAVLRAAAADAVPIGVERMLFGDAGVISTRNLEASSLTRVAVGLRIVALLLVAPEG